MYMERETRFVNMMLDCHYLQNRAFFSLVFSSLKDDKLTHVCQNTNMWINR